jgi:2,3-bisphosphoglycerate-independent phosphoglycerate mutase
MWDDRTPMILITFDGLGDRPSDELNGQTPLEAANTPNLDELTRIGVSGIHQPFGPGRATSSERSHWAMFGQTQTFPGRALLEATGMGISISDELPHFHLALRPAEIRDGQLHAIGRVSAEDTADCLDLFDALRVMPHELNPVLHPLRNGECILESAALPSHEISDSDPNDKLAQCCSANAARSSSKQSQARSWKTRTDCASYKVGKQQIRLEVVRAVNWINGSCRYQLSTI